MAVIIGLPLPEIVQDCRGSGILAALRTSVCPRSRGNVDNHALPPPVLQSPLTKCCVQALFFARSRTVPIQDSSTYLLSPNQYGQARAHIVSHKSCLFDEVCASACMQMRLDVGQHASSTPYARTHMGNSDRMLHMPGRPLGRRHVCECVCARADHMWMRERASRSCNNARVNHLILSSRTQHH